MEVPPAEKSVPPVEKGLGFRHGHDDIPLHEIEFLSLEDLRDHDRDNIQTILRAPTSGPPPGGRRPGSKKRELWRTPRPEREGLEFGGGTEVFNSLTGGGTCPPATQLPTNAPPPATPFVPLTSQLPLAAQPQHIHINNYTANCNIYSSSNEGSPHPSNTRPDSSGPASLQAQPPPFTGQLPYPSAYVAPFPQSSQAAPLYPGASYPTQMVVYQPGLHLSVYPPAAPPYPQTTQTYQQTTHDMTQSPQHHKEPKQKQYEPIQFGVTPVVSVLTHTSSDEDTPPPEDESKKHYTDHPPAPRDHGPRLAHPPPFPKGPVPQVPHAPPMSQPPPTMYHQPVPSYPVQQDYQPTQLQQTGSAASYTPNMQFGTTSSPPRPALQQTAPHVPVPNMAPPIHTTPPKQHMSTPQQHSNMAHQTSPQQLPPHELSPHPTHPPPYHQHQPPPALPKHQQSPPQQQQPAPQPVPYQHQPKSPPQQQQSVAPPSHMYQGTTPNVQGTPPRVPPPQQAAIKRSPPQLQQQEHVQQPPVQTQPGVQPPLPGVPPPSSGVQPSQPDIPQPPAEQPAQQAGEPSEAPAAKSWASLFSSGASGGPANALPMDKPTARIPPFSSQNSSGSENQDFALSAAPTVQDKELGNLLRAYQLNHMAPSFLPRGLTNRSNWCFVNAILQALLACPPFYNMMKALPSVVGLKVKSSTPMTDSVIEFVNEFQALEAMNKTQKKDKSRKKDDLPTGNPFEPAYVYRMLLSLESETFKVIEGRQEDAEEFLTCLLNGISDEMQGLLKLTDDPHPKEPPAPVQGPNHPEQGGAGGGDEWLEVGARGRSCVTRRVQEGGGAHDTPIMQLALGLCRSCVKSAGAETSATLQPFYTLQLDIQHSNVTSVMEALNANFAAEQLDGYICSKTKLEVEASRAVSLEDLPPILILHLKRFVYDSATGGVQKVMKHVEFSVDLEISRDILSQSSRSKFTLKQRQYKLFAVVYHNGREATKGHYVADVYHTGYANWLHCDDSIIKPTAEALVTAPNPNSVPYILFYRRCDTMVGVDKTLK